ncbi:hypothetical protein ACRQ1B_27505 [Rhizobium panacihumi]|uniref:hypothetical protein n=1 Tax=Rhizobium panacihumi TaxID=2008450 RepID=UPI003D796A53
MSQKAWREPGQAAPSPGAEETARRSGPDPQRCGAFSAPAPVGLEVDLDVDEEGDLDRDFQAELSFAEEVTGNLAESTQTAAGGGKELGELLNGGFSCWLRFIARMKSRPGKERRTGTAEAKAEDLEATEFCFARKPKAGENSDAGRLRRDDRVAPSLMSIKWDHKKKR